MIIYNVTLNIDKTISKEWLEWIKEHIPQVLATGKFKEAKLTKVLVEDEETDTYSVQYRAHSREALDAYYAEDAERLSEKRAKKMAAMEQDGGQRSGRGDAAQGRYKDRNRSHTQKQKSEPSNPANSADENKVDPWANSKNRSKITFKNQLQNRVTQ